MDESNLLLAVKAKEARALSHWNASCHLVKRKHTCTLRYFHALNTVALIIIVG